MSDLLGEFIRSLEAGGKPSKEPLTRRVSPAPYRKGRPRHRDWRLVYTVKMNASREMDGFLQALHTPGARALEKLGELYAQLDRDIAIRQPICTTSGRCCKFEIWGHRLYVSTLELAAFAHFARSDQTVAPPSDPNAALRFPLPLYQENRQFSPGCPWHINGLCTARSGRPLGCRIYFCDTTAESWQQERYEYYHKQITALHEAFEIPYRYMEWREALALLVIVPR